MNPVERVVRRLDRAQQRHKVPAFVVAVIKKYGDDNGGVLAANLAHSAFMSVFPLLLLLVTALVNVAFGNQTLRTDLIGAATSQFHGLIPENFVHNLHVLKRSSGTGFVVGVLWLIWGASQLAQAGLFTMEQVWNLPGPARPGYVQRLGRSALFLGVLAVGLVASTGLAALVTFGHRSPLLAVLAQVAAVVVNSVLSFTAFRVLTPKGVPGRNLMVGSVAGGVAWTLLEALGAYVVHHFLTSFSVYAGFATVLGLAAYISLGVEITVYAAEINVVLTRRLWPRSIVQPPLTEADRAVLAMQALENQRREEQLVEVTFSDRPADSEPPPQTPRHPEEIAPPGHPQGPEHPGPGDRAEVVPATPPGPNAGSRSGGGSPGRRTRARRTGR